VADIVGTVHDKKLYKHIFLKIGSVSYFRWQDKLRYPILSGSLVELVSNLCFRLAVPREFENRVLRGIFGQKKEEKRGGNESHNGKHTKFYPKISKERKYLRGPGVDVRIILKYV
jgi:hypothetical protein